MTRNLESNLWKSFVYLLTNRRHYITILSIYFMTLPDATAKMIGLYTAIGNFASFLLEIPSGYFADRFGHKNTMILAKIMMVISTLSFIFLQNFWGFVLGSVMLSVSFAFSSGTVSAFIHETLEELGRVKEYVKLKGKMSGNVSLVSMVLIICLPFLTQIDIVLPLKINLIFDIIGLTIAILLVKPKVHENIDEQKIKTISHIIKELWKLNFFPFAVFFGAISGFLMGESVFRYVYLESLGYPIIFVGFVMGASRFVWFLVGRYSYLIEENLTFRQMLKMEIAFFATYFFLIAYLSNPYTIATIFAIGVGYMWGRGEIIEDHILNRYITDKRYKATVISIKSQVGQIFQVIIPFVMGYLIASNSYQLGYYCLGSLLLIILFVSYLLMNKD